MACRAQPRRAVTATGGSLDPDGPMAVLITGGATGIGRAIADAFLAEGRAVHICDIDGAAVEAYVDSHPKASGTQADAANIVQVDGVFDDLLTRYGALDVLVNNVGIAGPTAAVEDIEPEDWDRTIAIDLNAQFYFTRRAVPLLRAAGGGSIINIASSAAFAGCPLRAPYVASKWAMIGFTKTLAMELGAHGIRVNAICPGSVRGPRIDGVIERDAELRGVSEQEIRDMYERQTSLRTFIDAEDVAQMALFLASDKGGKISGQAIGVDGNTESLSSWTGS